MEYKYCPNMIVIDTPGMLHAPKGRQLTPQQRALVQAAKEAGTHYRSSHVYESD
jgi:hypothetical protein